MPAGIGWQTDWLPKSVGILAAWSSVCARPASPLGSTDASLMVVTTWYIPGRKAQVDVLEPGAYERVDEVVEKGLDDAAEARPSTSLVRPRAVRLAEDESLADLVQVGVLRRGHPHTSGDVMGKGVDERRLHPDVVVAEPGR